jgi:prepilin-type processing-associated H-X9-DG protein
MPKMTKYYFTIIELLITIAVLVILISLLQPSLQNALKVARGVMCENNLKNIGVAMAGYTNDFNRFTPYYNYKVSSGPGNLVTWDDLLGQGYDGRNLTPEQMDAAYLSLNKEDKNSHAYLCPLDNGDWRTNPTGISSIDEPKAYAQARTYSINGFASNGGTNHPESSRLGITGRINGSSGVPSKPWSLATTDLIVPHQTIAITERPGLGFAGGGWNRIVINITWQDGIVMEGFGLNPLINKRYHNNGYMYLMADGHVENLTPEETMGPNGTMGSPKGLWSRLPND